MKKVLALSVLAGLAVMTCLAGAAFAQDAQSLPLFTHHVRDVVLNGEAHSVGRLPATRSMRLVLVLPLRNEAELDSFLQELYDPASPSYRQFLTVEEFTAKFGPTQEDYDSVIQFAKENGLSVVGTSRNRLNIDVRGSVATIEKAFHLTMGVYQHPTENRTFYAPDREPTPDLNVKLWRIAGMDNYSIPKPMVAHKDPSIHSNATTGSCPGQSFCGSDMRAAYYGGTALTGSGQSLGLFEFVGTDLADLTTYYKNAHQTLTVPVTLVSTDGTSTSCLASQGCDDTEQTLDMTQALGMAPGMSSLVMYVGSTDASILNKMATATPLNAQLSCSWSWRPPDPSTADPFFKQFAAQGQNFFVAAGDSGHWTTALPFVWPADDPFIVSVGGTDLQTNGAGGSWKSETAWVDGGGGISPNNFAIPSWQTATAAGCSECSKTIRNGPDVSANSDFTFYVCADQTTCSENVFGGTSFAAPMWAGYLALANQQAVANGGKVLGFINPSLYTIGLSSSYHTDFHDITSGSNGFNAVPGFDLATGWGSPNGAALITALVGGGGGNPDFTVSANPNAITVARGGSKTSTITTTVSGGFNAAITLSAPSHSISFSPNPIAAPGAGTSTMTVKVGANAKTGNYTIHITAKGGGVSHTTTVKLTIT
jgi:subtilase family serine protease